MVLRHAAILKQISLKDILLRAFNYFRDPGVNGSCGWGRAGCIAAGPLRVRQRAQFLGSRTEVFRVNDEAEQKRPHPDNGK
jgi:hypothetical protein